MKGLLYEDLTYKIRGAIFTVYNTIGFGHKEMVYQNALEEEFKNTNILYEREKSIGVFYKNIIVGKYRPDFLVDDKIILELKSVEYLQKHAEQQLLQYIRGTSYQLGILVNFGAPTLYIKRLILT